MTKTTAKRPSVFLFDFTVLTVFTTPLIFVHDGERTPVLKGQIRDPVGFICPCFFLYAGLKKFEQTLGQHTHTMAQRPCPYLGAAGLGQLDNDAWRTAAAQAEGLLLFQSEFQPPPGKATRSAEDPTLNEDEGRFVRPAHRRAVSSESKGAHQLQAIALAEFPGHNSAGSYKLPSDVCSAISVMIQHGANLPTLRESQVARLRSLSRICKPITEEMKRILAVSRPPSVRAVGDCMNVAFALVLAKALRWPHHWIGRALLLGFPITGVMESTGVLRPRDEPRKVEEFDLLRADILTENKKWLYVVHIL